MLHPAGLWLMFTLWAFAEGHPVIGSIAIALTALAAFTPEETALDVLRRQLGK